MTGVVTPTILSNGKKMDPTFQLVTIEVVKEIDRIPYAALTLLDGNSARQDFVISDDAFFEPGKEIEIKLRYEGGPGHEATIFKGLVVKLMVEARQDETLLTVELKDAAVKLTQGRQSAVFTQQSDSDVIGELIGKAGLAKGALASTQPTHPELVQYYCTDWDFILSRAEACGLVVLVEDGKISLQALSMSGSTQATYTFGMDDIYSFELEVDASHQRAGVESIAWDLQNHKLTQASKAKNFELGQGNLKPAALANAVGGKLETLASAVPMAPKTLQAWADGVLMRSRMAMLRGVFSIQGTAKIHSLDLVEIGGVGKRFNGKALVTGVRQRVDADGWRTDLQFGLSPEPFAKRRDIVDVPAAGLLPAVNGLQIGIVDQYTEDPEKEFRVKVLLPSIDEKQGAVWARLAVPEAGKERGYFFRPEPGDEVVMGFFNDDPGQAVILGALFGSKNTPPKDYAQLSEKNVPKGIVTKTGAALGFKDDEKPSLFIQTPGPNKILLDDDAQTIQITDQNGNSIELGKDGIIIKSAKDLRIEASGNVEINGSKVDIK